MPASTRFALTALTMVAFAANSLLNRAGLTSGGIDPVGFAAVRLASGALTLAVMVYLANWRRGQAGQTGQTAKLMQDIDAKAILGLTVYALGFSFAYLRLDAGFGALLLFGTVQIVMFAAAWHQGRSPSTLQILGAGVSLAGLAVLVWPDTSETAQATPLAVLPILLMLAAGAGWAVYSLRGAGQGDPLVTTWRNFTFATPLALLALIAVPLSGGAPLAFSAQGVGYAVASGAITSAMGYALWYRILPHLDVTRAALAQLTVPVIALAAGVLLLGEILTLRSALACLMICGGVALGMAKRTP